MRWINSQIRSRKRRGALVERLTASPVMHAVLNPADLPCFLYSIVSPS